VIYNAIELASSFSDLQNLTFYYYASRLRLVMLGLHRVPYLAD
jgi:hypothetical protein